MFVYLRVTNSLFASMAIGAYFSIKQINEALFSINQLLKLKHWHLFLSLALLNCMKRFPILILSFFILSCNQKQSNKIISSNKLGADTVTNTYAVESEDLSMNAAINKAKKTINQFDQALKSNNPGYADFAVKKRYKTPDGGGEHMWIAGISIVSGNYKGFVNNDAEKTNEVAYGDTVFVRRAEITDWMYLENNILRGGYTIREVRSRMNKEEGNKMEEDLGFKIED
jgi:uncharacterized protein YegJ (DUF2314 family)